MASENKGSLLRGVGRIFNQGSLTGVGEGQLLRQYASRGDEEAFEAIVRSLRDLEHDETLVYEIREDILLGQQAEDGAQLRPNIVWFEEPVPMIEQAAPLVRSADIFIVVGTSLVVYPAAGLVDFTRPGTHTFIVDKKIPYTSRVDNLTAIEMPASQGIAVLKEKLQSLM